MPFSKKTQAAAMDTNNKKAWAIKADSNYSTFLQRKSASKGGNMVAWTEHKSKPSKFAEKLLVRPLTISAHFFIS